MGLSLEQILLIHDRFLLALITAGPITLLIAALLALLSRATLLLLVLTTAAALLLVALLTAFLVTLLTAILSFPALLLLALIRVVLANLQSVGRMRVGRRLPRPGRTPGLTNDFKP